MNRSSFFHKSKLHTKRQRTKCERREKKMIRKRLEERKKNTFSLLSNFLLKMKRSNFVAKR